MNEPLTCLVGNLAGDPEIRYLPGSGAAVANFRVISTPRSFNKQTNEWEDGTPLSMRCAIWRQPAENVAETLHKGDRVIVYGRMKQNEYEKDGEKRYSVELDVEEVGPSLRYATASIEKKSGGGSGQGGGGGRSGGSSNSGGWDTPADPWANSGSKAYDDEPPF